MLKPAFALAIILDGSQPALWSINERREVMRFLRKRGKDIPSKELTRLVKSILLGPERDKYHEMEDAEWNRFSEYAIWLRLVKLKGSGAHLPKYVMNWLEKIQGTYDWKLRGDNSEEFSFYMTSGWGDQNKNQGGLLDFTSMTATNFEEWATEQKGEWDSEGGWVQFCKNQPSVAIEKLDKLSKHGNWPIAPWYDALSQLSNSEDLEKIIQQKTATLLTKMPIEKLAELDLMAARWLEKTHTLLDEKILWRLWEDIWAASKTNLEKDIKIKFDMTLNHAGGILAAILLDVLGKLHSSVGPGENPEIPSRLNNYFNIILEENNQSAALARTRLASSLLYLYRVDPVWATKALLSRMDITKEIFEPSLWEGYLWSPRIQSDLLVPIKPLFLNILDNIDKISERVRGHAIQLFTIVAVSPDHGFSETEAKVVLYNLPSNYLADSAQTLREMLRDAGDKASTLWYETIDPWFKKVWPRQTNAKTVAVSNQLSWMVLEANDAFPNAVAAVEKFLVPEEWPRSIHHLEKTDYPSRFPEASLKLANKLVDDSTIISGGALVNLLEKIVVEKPELKKDERFKRLHQLVQ